MHRGYNNKFETNMHNIMDHYFDIFEYYFLELMEIILLLLEDATIHQKEKDGNHLQIISIRNKKFPAAEKYVF